MSQGGKLALGIAVVTAVGAAVTGAWLVVVLAVVAAVMVVIEDARYVGR